MRRCSGSWLHFVLVFSAPAELPGVLLPSAPATEEWTQSNCYTLLLISSYRKTKSLLPLLLNTFSYWDTRSPWLWVSQNSPLYIPCHIYTICHHMLRPDAGREKRSGPVTETRRERHWSTGGPLLFAHWRNQTPISAQYFYSAAARYIYMHIRYDIYRPSYLVLISWRLWFNRSYASTGSPLLMRCTDSYHRCRQSWPQVFSLPNLHTSYDTTWYHWISSRE